MRLNRKGFVASAVLYSLLILFLALILGLLALLSNRKQILDKLKTDIKSQVSQTKEYPFYENGTVIYYNPETGKICSDYINDNSKTETKTGCMKWYIFNDNKNNATVNMILDHNTTALVAWNSQGTNTQMREVKTALESDTQTWKNKARLITADEIAKITGAKEILKWNSSKETGLNDIETKISWFYLDGTGTTYSSTDGWQKQVATSQGASKYAWLYDNTYGCTSYGCNVTDDNKYEYGTAGSTNYMYGYWTSSTLANDMSRVWYVSRTSRLYFNTAGYLSGIGVRPVITLRKNEIKDINEILININDVVLPLKKESDGSTWARVFYHNNKNGTVLFVDEDEVLSTSQVDKISALKYLNNFKNTDGNFEFMLKYPKDTDKYNRWIQTSNPTEERISDGDGTETATGYEKIDIDSDSNYWGGLTLSTSSSTYLNGSVGHKNWFYAIGAYKSYNDGIPATTDFFPSTGATGNVIELWVRVDDYLKK